MAGAEIFVYYRIAAADTANVCREVALFQGSLCGRFTGLQARLMRRAEDDAAENPTLMETYAMPVNEDGATLAELLAAIEQAARAVEPWLIGVRHVEVFEPCA